MKDSADFKREVRTKPKTKSPLDFKKGLSTGSTLLNLACTGKPNIGYLPGYYYYFVGDSDSGKSFITLNAFAEASINEVFKDYRLIHDNPERGTLMDMSKFYGKAMVERLEPPRGDSERPCYSSTVEEFYYNLDDAISKGPCIYILDSMDAIYSEDDEKKFLQKKKHFRKKGGEQGEDKDVAGSYGTAKAKMNSSNMRLAHNKLKDNGSILVVISQTRDNIGTFSFEKKTRAGGHALRFYATVVMWSSIKEKITKNVRGKNRHLGNICRINVKRTRFTGRQASVDIPIYYSHGIDDVGACIDYLIEERQWSKSGATISAKDFGFSGTYESLVKKIESEGLEKDLSLLVSDVWKEIESLCAIERKPRYQ